ncbi:MAG: hypothetical protein HP002_13725, partial [Lentisphaeria bacterium]|nr:hypothetical protein [Lentisphaeria bacterium]
ARVRALLDAKGFTGTELHLNEWHYFNADWKKLRSDARYCREVHTGADGINGIDAAAFAVSVLTRWQDTPLDLGNYYTATVMQGWGLFDNYGIPFKTYHALKAFGELAGGARFRAASPSPEVTVLAGDGAVLVSRFKSTKPVSVVFEGGMPERMQVHLLDREHDLEPVAAEPAGNVLALPGEGSAVWLIATA